jgi:hypothetical protein
MNRECWTEMDLYWFQGQPLDTKVRQLFDRVSPLWQRSPDARKGISLCVGFLYDSILYWNGNPDDVVATCQPPVYEPWTYRRLSVLIGALKAEAASRGIVDFHVAIAAVGWKSMSYDATQDWEGWGGRTEEVTEKHRYSIEGKWFFEHPEITADAYGIYYFGCTVNVPINESVCTLPAPTFGEYFADKLCSMAAFTGFDAVVLRDGVFSMAYRRGNKNRYMAPQARASLNASFIQLFKRIKSQIPSFITIGYDSGASSMEELRSHGFDLEEVALSGYLDLWITQTWASAWQDYWPMHSLGYTFQLSSLLVNLAMLANSPCRHMFLLETFDAWEPWDSIHQYPSKVAWEVWAYSHAAVKLPENGLKRTDGCYISWLNRGKDELIPSETVEKVRSILDDCEEDLKRDPAPGGPCLVYHREGLLSLLNNPADNSRGEEMDDWAAMLQKYGTPLLSITRSEWLGRVEADGFIFPAPARIGHDLCGVVLGKIKSGIPVMFTGQASQLSNELREALSVDVEELATECALATAAEVEDGLALAIGTKGLMINQHQRSLKANDEWIALIQCIGGPVFAKHTEKACFIWETPEWGTPNESHLTCKTVGTPQTFRAVSDTFGKGGWGAERYEWTNDDWQKPVCFLFWRYRDGGAAMLLGNLETGMIGNSQFAVKGTLTFSNSESHTVVAKKGLGHGRIKETGAGFHIALAPHNAYIVMVEDR